MFEQRRRSPAREALAIPQSLSGSTRKKMEGEPEKGQGIILGRARIAMSESEVVGPSKPKGGGGEWVAGSMFFWGGVPPPTQSGQEPMAIQHVFPTFPCSPGAGVPGSRRNDPPRKQRR